jgi:hypothetical protein
VRSRTTLLAALAVALAALPATATDPADGPKPVHDVGDSQVERFVPEASTPSIRRALEGLQHLRLRPGADGFDIVETTRGRPHEAR